MLIHAAGQAVVAEGITPCGIPAVGDHDVMNAESSEDEPDPRSPRHRAIVHQQHRSPPVHAVASGLGPPCLDIADSDRRVERPLLPRIVIEQSRSAKTLVLERVGITTVEHDETRDRQHVGGLRRIDKRGAPRGANLGTAIEPVISGSRRHRQDRRPTEGRK